MVFRDSRVRREQGAFVGSRDVRIQRNQAFLANQFRLLLHVAAYALIQTMQTALAGTALAAAQAGTLRLKLLKVAARVWVRCRVVRVQLPSSYPWETGS